MRHRIRWFLGGLVLVAGCSFPAPVVPESPVPLDLGSPNPMPKQPLIDAFDRNLAKWQAAGITTYAFTYEPVCFCDATARLVVADEAGIRVDGVAPDQRTNAPAGVPGLFELVRRAISGDRVSVSYDPATGVPLAMDSDPIANAIDDELRFTVTGWTLQPPDDHVLGGITHARQVWQGNSLLSYRMTVKVNHEVYVATIEDGDSTVTQSGRRVRDLEGIPATVEVLFDIAAFAATTGRTTVTFDPRLAYPAVIDIAPDPTGESIRWTYRVTAFSVP